LAHCYGAAGDVMGRKSRECVSLPGDVEVVLCYCIVLQPLLVEGEGSGREETGRVDSRKAEVEEMEGWTCVECHGGGDIVVFLSSLDLSTVDFVKSTGAEARQKPIEITMNGYAFVC
jgi:hypothetical protein